MSFDPLEEAQNILAEFEKSSSALPLPPAVIHKSEWLYDIARDICGYKDLKPQPHYEMCEFEEGIFGDCNFRDGGQKFGMALVPRNSFKTCILVQSAIVGLVAKNPNIRILVTSHTAPQASARIVTPRKIIERSEAFERKYGEGWVPEQRKEQWSDKAWTVARRTDYSLREATVTCASVGADLTGSHFDVILADDLVTLDNVYTREQRDKVYEYLTSLYSYLEPNGSLVVIGTRWHADDAYGRLIKTDDDRAKRDEERRYRYLIRSCWDGPNGLYFPDHLTHQFLKTIREDIKGRRFAANYENKTIADEDKTFAKEHLQLREFDYFHDQRQGYVKLADQMIPVSVSMTWDTAGSKATSKSDYHGVAVRGLDKFGRWWMCEAAGLKGTPLEVITRIVALISFYKPAKVYIESVGAYEFWVRDAQEALDRVGCTTQFVPLSHDGIPKAERIELLEPIWSNNLIIMKPEQTMAISQFDDFSVTSLPTYDDVIDAISAFLKDRDTPDEGVQYIEHPNPIDPEWVKREERIQKNEGGNSLINRIFSRRRRKF